MSNMKEVFRWVVWIGLWVLAGWGISFLFGAEWVTPGSQLSCMAFMSFGGALTAPLFFNLIDKRL